MPQSSFWPFDIMLRTKKFAIHHTVARSSQINLFFTPHLHDKRLFIFKVHILKSVKCKSLFSLTSFPSTFDDVIAWPTLTFHLQTHAFGLMLLLLLSVWWWCCDFSAMMYKNFDEFYWRNNWSNCSRSKQFSIQL